MMVKEFYNLGISNDEYKVIVELNPNVIYMSEDDIKEKDYLLRYIGCTLEQIRSILVCNPMVLNRDKEDIISLIQKLISLGFDILNLLFESNPFILNLDSFEIDEYINKRQSMGESLDDIVDDLDSNPYLFNEM